MSECSLPGNFTSRPATMDDVEAALELANACSIEQIGKPKSSLDVDAQNITGATRLYERAGMHVQRQHHQYEQELRPGRDLSIQSLGG